MTANLIFEILVLGLLYNAFMDTTEDTTYFEDDADIQDDYDLNDFLLTIAACAITQFLNYILLYLLIDK